MSLRAWFRPPRHVLALFLLLTLAPSALLIVLEWHSLRQDRAGELANSREQTLDLVVSNLQQRLSSVERELQNGLIKDSDDSVVVVFEPGSIQGKLLFYPFTSAGTEAPGTAFAPGEKLEAGGDRVKAAAFFSDLARSADPAVHAGAMFLLARNLGQRQQNEAALAKFRQVATIQGIADGRAGVPIDLLARQATLDLLTGDERRREERALHTDLLSGRWRLDRPTLEATLLPERLPQSPAIALAEAAGWLWRRWPTLEGTSDREALSSDGREITVVWQGDPHRLTALIAGPDFVERNWTRPIRPVLDRQHATVTLAKPGTTPASSLQSVRTIQGLPWAVVVESGPPPGPGVRWIAAFSLLALIAILGTYVIARAVVRELKVARLQSDFVSAVSHEFRTPLTSMRQFTEILSDGRLLSEDRRHEYYDALTRQTNRLQRLVENLLDFGRMDGRSLPYRLEPLDGSALVQSVVEQFEHEARGRGYHLELTLPAAAVTIAADHEALTTALWNLLDNAVKYSPDCRTIWVEVAREDGRLAIRVRDRGLGIPRHEHTDIFRKFVRGASAKARSIKGTGIGLAMVEHIVKGHDGEVRVQSEPGAGSTFTLFLPCHES